SSRRARQHDAARHGAAAFHHAGGSGRSHLRGTDGGRDYSLPRSSRLGPAGAGNARACTLGDGGLSRRRSIGRKQRAGGAAVFRSAKSPRGRVMPKKNPKHIGLAIVGAGRVGLIRGEVAARHAQVDFIGVAEIKPDRAKLVADKIGADFVTSDYRELLARPEVTAAIIATDEHLHVAPILA